MPFSCGYVRRLFRDDRVEKCDNEAPTLKLVMLTVTLTVTITVTLTSSTGLFLERAREPEALYFAVGPSCFGGSEPGWLCQI